MRAALRRAWSVWQEISLAIGDFQSRLLLTLFYFIVAAVFGVAVRVFIDPLRLRHPSGDSAWARRPDSDTHLAGAQRQF